MTNYIVCERDNLEFHAGSKARNDVADVALGEGWLPIYMRKGDKTGALSKIAALPPYLRDWKMIATTVERGDTLLLQYPLFMYPHVQVRAKGILHGIHSRGIRIVALVHDLDSLRGHEYGRVVEDTMLGECDVIIAHNDAMRRKIEERGYSAMIITLDIFDYLAPKPHRTIADRRGVDIAGNLDPEKCGYVYRLADEMPDAHINLYGPKYDASLCKADWYRGSYPPEKLPEHLLGAFGLVWDGESIETCAGGSGEYLRYNNPHKLSLYLSSGEPVIVWRDSAVAPLVEREGMGVVVSSIREAIERISSMDESEYLEIRGRAERFGELLRDGHFTRLALDKVLDTA